MQSCQQKSHVYVCYLLETSLSSSDIICLGAESDDGKCVTEIQCIIGIDKNGFQNLSKL